MTSLKKALSGRAACLAALAAVVFFSRAWLIRAWGSPLPFMDQWDAEAAQLYLPWLNGTLQWPDLFRAHNEHRITLTRLADLVLFAWNSGWNPWAQLLLNAALHAATAAVLAGIFWRELPPWARAVLTAGLAVLFSSPCGWQNALWGFQLHSHFGNLLAVAALAGLLRAPPLSLPWWLGGAAAVLSLFSGASGVLVVAVAFGASQARSLLHPSREGWAAAFLLALLLGTAIAFSVSVPQHAPLQAKSVSQFVQVFARCLAWPFVDQPWFALLTQLPLAALAFTRWRQRKPLDAAERCALALGALILLHAAAVAYSRGGALVDFRPLSRYQDLLLLGAAVQLFAALKLALNQGRTGRLVLLGWSGAVAIGLVALTEKNLTLHLPYKRMQDRAALAAVRSYLQTADAMTLRIDPATRWLHPDPSAVQRILDKPELRLQLPKELRGTLADPPAIMPAVVTHSPAFMTFSICALLAALAVSSLKKRE